MRRDVLEVEEKTCNGPTAFLINKQTLGHKYFYVVEHFALRL